MALAQPRQTDSAQDRVLVETSQRVPFEIDDRLVIKIEDKDHLVDTIVQFKKTLGGVPQFKLAMCCNCCRSREYWYSIHKIK